MAMTDYGKMTRRVLEHSVPRLLCFASYVVRLIMPLPALALART